MSIFPFLALALPAILIFLIFAFSESFGMVRGYVFSWFGLIPVSLGMMYYLIERSDHVEDLLSIGFIYLVLILVLPILFISHTFIVITWNLRPFSDEKQKKKEIHDSDYANPFG